MSDDLPAKYCARNATDHGINPPFSRELEATEVFGGVDETHPAVKYLFNTAGEYYVGGKLDAINRLAHYDFLDLRCEQTTPPLFLGTAFAVARTWD